MWWQVIAWVSILRWLYVAGVIDFAAGLRLVKRRAELMSEASEGAMAALMGF